MRAAGWMMALAASVGAALPACAQDVAEGEKIYQAVCRSCHGPKAQGMASFPKLTGHTEAYLTQRLEQYRSGEKVGPNTPLMAPNAADLTDGEIADIVAYITTTFD